MKAKKIFIDVDMVKSELLKLGVQVTDEKISIINSSVKALISEYKKRPTIAMEQYKTAKPFFDIYKTYDKLNLPDWVVKRIDEARVMGASSHMIIFPDGSKYQINNPLNDLSASEWLKFTTSVFSTFYSTRGEDSYAHNIRKIHPSPKPPQLMRDIISFFTKEGDLILDYFMGVGGSLLGASLCHRQGLGIELCPKYINAYKRAAIELKLPVLPVIQSDCLSILKDGTMIEQFLNGKKFSLIIIDPPYANMMSRKKTGADIKVYGNKATPFTNDHRDFGNMTIDTFLTSLKESIKLSQNYLKTKGYIIVFIKDLQPNKKTTNLLHADIISKINELDNIQYKGLKIWEDRSAKLFPYGYPLSFVSNQIHQFVLIFRKEK